MPLPKWSVLVQDQVSTRHLKSIQALSRPTRW